MRTFILLLTYSLAGSSDHNSRSSNFDEIISNLGAAADQILDENQLKYFISLLRDKIGKDQRVKNQESSDIDEDFHGFKPHIQVPEIVPETVSETVSETVPEIVSEAVSETVSETIPEIVPGTAQWWASYTVSETVSKTILDTVPETVSKTIPDTIPDKYRSKNRPKNRPKNRRRRKPKWLRTTTTKVGWNTPTGFYYNQTS